MKRWLIIGVIGLPLMTLTGCSSESHSAAAATTGFNKVTDIAAITDLEVRYHKFRSGKDLDGLMTLFTDDAILTAVGQTYSGKDQIRGFLAQSGPMKPENHWTLLTRPDTVRATTAGDQGTLYFECYYTDVAAKQLKAVVSANAKVSRIKGQWFVKSIVAGPVSTTY